MPASKVKSQCTDSLFMVRPSKFGFNRETSSTNVFQHEAMNSDSEGVQAEALREFDQFVNRLREQKIYVTVLQDPGLLNTPDSLFPNNWISFHRDTMILYPLLAENRRKEKRSEWINLLRSEYHVNNVIDLSGYENQNQYLEGTGSIVLDRKNDVIYGNISSRTNPGLLKDIAAKLNYEPVTFSAHLKTGEEIYHTNVVMAIGEWTAVICSEVISDKKERNAVLKNLGKYHRVVEIDEHQLKCFAGNMLLVKNRDNKKFWVMSEQAFRSLSKTQIEVLKTDGGFICSDLQTIETIGGGSARCMMAEIF